MSTERDIVCLSSQRWDDGMWTNKQHVMSRLAREHRVIHVNHGLNPLPAYLYKHLKDRPTDLLRPKKLLTEGVRRRDGNLHLGDGFAPIFTGLLPYSSSFRDYWTFDFKVEQVRRHLEREEIEEPVVWVYHPGFGDAVDKLPASLVVYDCVDNYAAFPHYEGDRQWLIEREERLCRRADVVFTTAQELYDQRVDYNPDHTHLVHNVGDARHFKTALNEDLPVAEELQDMDGPVIGFVGAVSNYKLNEQWLMAAADAHPEWNVVVIGPVGVGESGTDVSGLRERPNIHLLGHRDYETLPSYLKGFDVATIPYNINEYTLSCFPIKFFEYMATGTPVVISNLPALEEHYDIAHVAETAEEFVADCERAVEQSETGEGAEARVERAEQNSWETKIEEMMGIVEARLEQFGRS